MFQFCFQSQLGKFWERLPSLSLPLSSHQPLGSSYGCCLASEGLSSTVRNVVCAWCREGRVFLVWSGSNPETTMAYMPRCFFFVMKTWSVMMSKQWCGVLRGCGLEVLLLSTLNCLLNYVTVDGFGFPSQGRQGLHRGSPIWVRQISLPKSNQWRGKWTEETEFHFYRLFWEDCYKRKYCNF